MREILFRGKRTNDNEWVYGSFIPTSSKNTKQDVCGIKDDTIYRIVHLCKLKTVGQYTGLTDKNGTKIFEGDILQFDYIGENLGVEGIANVVFNNGKFGVLWGYHKEFVCIDGFANTEITVIGNIHDNPELL